MSSSGGGGGGIGQGVANLGSGLVSGITGYFQRRKAKKMLNNLHQPAYTIPNEVLQNQKMAQQAANEGMASQQYNNAMKGFRQTEADALAGARDRRSALMALPRIQQQTNANIGNLDAQDDAIRQQNRRTLYGINSQVAGYRDKAFDINQMQPYQRDYSYAMGLLGAGNQNLLSGADKILAGGGQLLDAGSGGGKKRKSSGGNTGEPNYYNGYGPDSNYSEFEPFR
jgi:hypothetical protein